MALHRLQKPSSGNLSGFAVINRFLLSGGSQSIAGTSRESGNNGVLEQLDGLEHQSDRSPTCASEEEGLSMADGVTRPAAACVALGRVPGGSSVPREGVNVWKSLLRTLHLGKPARGCHRSEPP